MSNKKAWSAGVGQAFPSSPVTSMVASWAARENFWAVCTSTIWVPGPIGLVTG